ncbi:uncharacterized protein [Nicotiana tomentosiformis]|uniref:uncharacterized protein n=1 Tax=Nicotiana tomentosiformis TaxID=4098 RepID=UPI00388C78C6
MSMTDYEARFSELSRHSFMILPTDAERMRRFVTGLHTGIQATMAREVEMGTSYELIVEIAQRIEGVRQHSREQAMRDKQFQYSGEFRGAPTGGRGQFVRGQSSRPTYPAPPPPRGAPVRPYLSVMPESSYHPPAIQGSSSGYSGHQGQTSVSLYAVITGIISICGRDASVLFDPGSTYSYVSSLFAHFLGVSRESLGTLVYVSTPMDDSVIVDRIYWSCIVTFSSYETRADLLLLDMTDFEVILGMDWLSRYHAILDCPAKTVNFVMPELPRLEWKGSSVSASSRVISFLKARYIVEKGCLYYLAYIWDTTAETTTIDSVPIVREFTDVFPSDLPSMPSDRDIDFCIDLALGT